MRLACGRKHRASVSRKTVQKYGWLWHHSLAALSTEQQIRLADLDGDSKQKSPKNQEINRKK
jgi:hypothetical protein